MSDFDRLVSIFGLVTSVLGIVIAVIQTLRFRASQELLREVKRIRNASIWTNIALILQAFDSVENGLKIEPLPENVEKLHNKFQIVRRTIVNCYFQMLRDATLDEPEFNEETLERWKAQGKIENEWREKQAKRLIYHEQRNVPRRNPKLKKTK